VTGDGYASTSGFVGDILFTTHFAEHFVSPARQESDLAESALAA